MGLRFKLLFTFSFVCSFVPHPPAISASIGFFGFAGHRVANCPQHFLFFSSAVYYLAQVRRPRVLFALSLTFYIYLSLIPLTLTLLHVTCLPTGVLFGRAARAHTSSRNPTCLPHLQQICYLPPTLNQLLFLCSKDLHVSLSLSF